MLGRLCLVGALPLLLLAAPASALTKAQKMETCKFGADNQKLTGAKRKTFMTNCMANRDDKRGPATGAKPASAPAAAGSDSKDSN